mmetsp:Transcript_32848/g.75117  ORF Transcript_32848/g.75117 Transcript_32848/m.75117 type:complete len:383 (+) Transcript_32848:1077-2225(+)
MHGHVPALNPTISHCLEGTEVLGQSNGSDNLRELTRRHHAHHVKIRLGSGMQRKRATDDAQCKRKLDATVKLTIRDPPARQRAVMAVPSSVCVSSSLDRAPVVTGRQHNGVNAVHNSLVVRCRASRAGVSKLVALHDALRDTRALASNVRKVLHRNGDLCASKSAIRQICQDAETSCCTRKRFGIWGESFGNRVHHVGTHRVTAVEVELQAKHVLYFSAWLVVGQPLHIHASNAPSPGHQSWLQRVCFLSQPVKCAAQLLLGFLDIRNGMKLDLASHDRFVTVSVKPATESSESGHVAASRNNRRLLHNHWSHDVTAVHQKIDTHSHRERVHADRIFHHQICRLVLQATVTVHLVLTWRHESPLKQLVKTLGHAQLSKARQP